MLTRRQAAVKRTTDIAVSLLGLVTCGWLIVLAACLAWIDTGKCGLFRQQRVGLHGRRFTLLKVRTMREIPGLTSTVTTSGDPRITRLGQLLRRFKLDELPQLVNVLRGDMSMVGPRPDVPEVADRLHGEAPLVLTVRPGITGPASLKYRREEELLAGLSDPDWVNEAVLFPDKTRLNTQYVEEYRWLKDWHYLWQTLGGTGEVTTREELTDRITHARQAA
jgi:lipopolysaccharide/colanic/teichoic acid biosynthesis glycosyltransferase